MSKYQHYADELDTAFKSAREQFMNAYDAVKLAEKGVEDAKNERDKRYVGEADLLREERLATLHRAEAALRIVQEQLWPAFDEVVDELTAKLKKTVQADSVATPENIDVNGLTLLQSGILRVDELEGFLDRYSDNITMSRILAQHCRAAAETERDQEKRGRLMTIARDVDNEQNDRLKLWDALLDAAKVCTGRSHGETKPDPGFVVTISKRWEQLTEGIVESF